MPSPASPMLADPKLFRSQAWLDGQWVDAPSRFPVTNSADGSPILQVPNPIPSSAPKSKYAAPGPNPGPTAVLGQADAGVLLASFGRFVPEGPSDRKLRAAMAAMAEQLASAQAGAMLQTFLERAAAPQAASLLPPGISAAPLGESGRQRLAQDLALLAGTAGLPPGFPRHARVLNVEGGADQIVVPEARALLRDCLVNTSDAADE